MGKQWTRTLEDALGPHPFPYPAPGTLPTEPLAFGRGTKAPVPTMPTVRETTEPLAPSISAANLYPLLLLCLGQQKD
jgi:hypothetical protein